MTIDASALALIRPEWPAPANIQAWASTRRGGVSTGPWAGLNLAEHVGDTADAVAQNRALLRTALRLPAEPGWLTQVHGDLVVQLPTDAHTPTADAACSSAADTVCAVLTADCLPVLFCDRAGTWLAAAHAGWRGLAAGVLEATVRQYAGRPEQVLAWLGPAIGPQAFEVGPEVRDAFFLADPGAAPAFQPSAGDRWFADLYRLARRRLAAVGVNAVFGGDFCTVSDPDRFYSYRRDGVTGRQATLIWRSAP